MKSKAFASPTYGIAALIVLAAVALLIYGTPYVKGAAENATEPAENSDMVRVRVFGPDGNLTDPVDVPRVDLTDDEWRERLTPEQFAILRSEDTERPFCGMLLDNKKEGYYLCAGCDLPLFSSDSKFESGTGWPSFFQPVAEENVHEETDRSYGMIRTEIQCARCGGHLGHVFEDGPKPTGLRFCLNSEAMRFVEKKDVKKLAETVPAASEATSGNAALELAGTIPAPKKDLPLADQSAKAKAVFANGCFWCTEAVFEQLPHVSAVVSGYCGGDPGRADYKSVCTGTTGHAEAVEITYDPSKITYGQLLQVFFASHDPTTKDRQGPDRGTQYRSAVFYQNEKEKEVAAAYIDQLNAAKAFDDTIVTTLEPMDQFFPAEDYHQDFVKNSPDHPYVRMWAVPKVNKIQKLLLQDQKS